jgi:hypothetical protein
MRRRWVREQEQAPEPYGKSTDGMAWTIAEKAAACAHGERLCQGACTLEKVDRFTSAPPAMSSSDIQNI